MKSKLQVILTAILLGFFTVVINSQVVQAQERSKEGEEPLIIHPIPLVPIIVDGVRMAPEEIKKFNGQELYYLVNDESKAQEVVFIFTTLEGIETAAALTAGNDGLEGGMYTCVTPTDVWKDVDFQGDHLYLGISPTYGTGSGSFGGTSWDNNVESVHTTTCNLYTKFYDTTYYSGSQLWLASNGWTSWLVPYGWDNRAGSWKIEP